MKENLFSEFILNKFDVKYKTRIQVCVCENFTIIKGETESEDVISVKDLTSEFSKEYEEFEIKNTFDLINYKEKVESLTKISLIFSEVPNIENLNYFQVSSFPFGCPIEEKAVFLLFENITQIIPSVYPYNWIKFDVLIDENNQIDFQVFDDYINNENDVLRSAILDSVNLNLEYYVEQLKKLESNFLFEERNNIFSLKMLEII